MDEPQPLVKSKSATVSIKFRSSADGSRDHEVQMIRRSITMKSIKYTPRELAIMQAQEEITEETRAFGISLEELVRKGKHYFNVAAPLYEGIAYLEVSGLNEEGLYRIPGSKKTVDMFRTFYDSGYPVIFHDNESAHTISSLIIGFLRDVPGSIFSETGFMRLQSIRGSGDDMLHKVKDILAELPPPYHASVNALIWHLRRVSDHREHTKMDARNLAMCIFPLLVGPVLVMINHCEELFPDPIEPTLQAVTDARQLCGKAGVVSARSHFSQRPFSLRKSLSDRKMAEALEQLDHTEAETVSGMIDQSVERDNVVLIVPDVDPHHLTIPDNAPEPPEEVTQINFVVPDETCIETLIESSVSPPEPPALLDGPCNPVSFNPATNTQRSNKSLDFFTWLWNGFRRSASSSGSSSRTEDFDETSTQGSQSGKRRLREKLTRFRKRHKQTRSGDQPDKHVVKRIWIWNPNVVRQ
eukprot:c7570_g1_i2.p1 GENE.c7570_g1_i2~~c7570_g1_i2.p1  ORF type:complete len:469 (-),score=50.96 c7570_g1_i2:49-1455(-)